MEEVIWKGAWVMGLGWARKEIDEGSRPEGI